MISPSHIVTYFDETCLSYVNVKTKNPMIEWGHTGSLRKPVKCWQTFSAKKKLMTTVFWNRKRCLLVYFMEQSTTINSAIYCDTLRKLRRAINKWCGMLTSGIIFLHDKAVCMLPHTQKA